MMTIAYDAKRAFWNERGLGNYSRTLLQQLSEYYPDNRYLLCTPTDTDRYPFLHQQPFETITPSALWRLAPAIWRRAGMAQALKDQSVHIYHGLSQELPLGIEDVGCKTIVTMHDAIFLRYPELYSPTYVRLFTRKNEEACRKADVIIAISEQTKRDFMHFFKVPEPKIRIVYQGCNDVFWQPMTSQQLAQEKKRFDLPDHYVLSVGALEPRKNAISIIEAMAHASIDMPLVLVGNGKENYKHYLQDRAHQLGIPLRLIAHAKVTDLPAIYRLCSLFVYPSLFEGFGIPILEAARSQAPIIASLGTCFEEIAGEGALYVPPTDIQAMGEAMKQILGDPMYRATLCQQALQTTEHFCAQDIVQHLWQIYQTC